MTDLMTILPVILVQLCPGGDQRAKSSQFQLHSSQVWICVFVLSCWTISTWAVPNTRLRGLQLCVEKLMPVIEKSDAMLYTPSIHDIKVNCEEMLLNCYMLELIVVLNEEEVKDNNADCILEFTDRHLNFNSVGCLPCEAYSLQNITIFLDRFNTYLQMRRSANI